MPKCWLQVSFTFDYMFALVQKIEFFMFKTSQDNNMPAIMMILQQLTITDNSQFEWQVVRISRSEESSR